MPFDFSSLFGSDDEEEDPNLTRRMRNPYMMNLYGGSDSDTTPDVGIDPADEATAHYMSRAKESLPSEGIFRDYLSRRPEEDSTENQPKWWERLIGGLSTLGGPQSAAAGKGLINRHFNKAYADWQTEGKYITPSARSADEGRRRELEAERFGIIGASKKRSFEETQKVHRTTEEARKTKAEADAKTKAASEARAESREERATTASERASKSLSLSESREARAEEEAKRRGERELRGEQTKLTERRDKSLKTEEKDIPTQVKREITSDARYRKYFERNEKGQIVPTEEGVEAGILDLIDSEINKRSMVSGIRHGRTY